MSDKKITLEIHDDHMKEVFYIQREKFKKIESDIEELSNGIEFLRGELESINSNLNLIIFELC